MVHCGKSYFSLQACLKRNQGKQTLSRCLYIPQRKLIQLQRCCRQKLLVPEVRINVRAEIRVCIVNLARYKGSAESHWSKCLFGKRQAVEMQD